MGDSLEDARGSLDDYLSNVSLYFIIVLVFYVSDVYDDYANFVGQ